MPEDWAAVAAAIDTRVRELGWRQRELSERAHVSHAIVREIQHHIVERRRSTRTLEALSTALGWPPSYLHSLLHGQPSAQTREAQPTYEDHVLRRAIGETRKASDRNRIASRRYSRRPANRHRQCPEKLMIGVLRTVRSTCLN